MAQLNAYQQTRVDRAREALASSVADHNPDNFARHLGALEVELGDMIHLVEQLEATPNQVGTKKTRQPSCWRVSSCEPKRLRGQPRSVGDQLHHQVRIPIESDHLFRSNPIADSGVSDHLAGVGVS